MACNDLTWEDVRQGNRSRIRVESRCALDDLWRDEGETCRQEAPCQVGFCTENDCHWRGRQDAKLPTVQYVLAQKSRDNGHFAASTRQIEAAVAEATRED